jgi:predicted flap endonuclease-1-like 5' DNA nuclease
MSYKISEIEGIGPARASTLAEAGITTTDHLLDHCASAKGRAAVAATTQFSTGQLLKWANMADLMRISGVASEYAELLEAAGVDTVKELGTRRPDNLTKKMAEVNAEKKLVRAVPTEASVTKWVDQAKGLDARITH